MHRPYHIVEGIPGEKIREILLFVGKVLDLYT